MKKFLYIIIFSISILTMKAQTYAPPAYWAGVSKLTFNENIYTSMNKLINYGWTSWEQETSEIFVSNSRIPEIALVRDNEDKLMLIGVELTEYKSTYRYLSQNFGIPAKDKIENNIMLHWKIADISFLMILNSDHYRLLIMPNLNLKNVTDISNYLFG